MAVSQLLSGGRWRLSDRRHLFATQRAR